jgi:hypothetical protein
MQIKRTLDYNTSNKPVIGIISGILLFLMAICIFLMLLFLLPFSLFFILWIHMQSKRIT